METCHWNLTKIALQFFKLIKNQIERMAGLA